MKRHLVEQLVGQYVNIENGPFRDRSLAIVIGYGYRQRHGRQSPVEPDWTSRSGGSQVAIALRNRDGTWTAEAVSLMRIFPHDPTTPLEGES